MSKTTTYKCNLCGRTEKSIEAKKNLKAFYWKSDKSPQGYVLTDNLDSCDRHICNNCIEIIKGS
jgi:hypothetical protein